MLSEAEASSAPTQYLLFNIKMDEIGNKRNSRWSLGIAMTHSLR